MSYDLYVWRWADNDEPGRVEAVISAIGEAPLPASVGYFDTAAFLDSLEPTFGSRQSEDCPFIADTGEDLEDKTSWITFNVTWSAAKHAVPALCEAAAAAGLTAYDPQQERIPEPCRPKTFVVEIEDEAPIYDPTEAEVMELLSRLEPSERSFVILEPSDGGYVQCAGSPDRLTVEWRTDYSSSFRHYVGERATGSSAETKIASSQGFVTVQEKQVLTLADVAPVFSAFLAGRPVQSLLNWSDITSRFE